MYTPLVVAIQKSIINYIDLIFIKVTKQSKEKTGLIKKKGGTVDFCQRTEIIQ